MGEALRLHIGDRVIAELQMFSGRVLGPSGSVPYVPSSPDGPDILIWAVEDTRTLEVRHLRQDHLAVVWSRFDDI
ncbi:MAG: hypothetical protein JWP85_2678 [Rhodoglobus sp.]|nr:hypothetical protein [Rhodoglobus sp.]